ncbi:MAG TPA: metallophosphoesterase [Terracidiphilus sp.]|nr:metallophosphoesterase [Terracidiphilus sp.]
MLRSFVPGMLCVLGLGVAGACLVSAAAAPAHAAVAGKSTVRVLMVSDIHFDPFWDPGKAKELAAVPESRWAEILSAAPSPDRAERFAALQKRCHAKGADTDYALLASSLKAMGADAAGAAFATVSGDLLAHQFSCKYDAAIPQATPGENEIFAAKTLDFVLQQLRVALPGVPVYTALGNNDSGCGDYHIDAGGAFLRTVAPALSANAQRGERRLARRDIARGGYYSVKLPAPMERARLLVLEDVFMSEGYETCAGKPDAAPAEEQIAWLRRQLEKARREHEKVWVMAHIPPGIDPYSTIRKFTNVCAGGAPVKFLGSGALAATIAEFGDVVRLAIFAHTHMDEFRLLRAKKAGGQQSAVAVKLVPSISPIRDNAPAFVVASVEPATAMLKDYQVIASSNETGAEWREEYDFDRAYGEAEFSAASVSRIIARFRADPEANTAASEEYLRNYYVGDRSAVLKLFWPEYTCTLANDTVEEFRSCMCSENKDGKNQRRENEDQ